MAEEQLDRLKAARYTVQRELGSGGMATVYLAEGLRHERTVPLQVLRSELTVVFGAERTTGTGLPGRRLAIRTATSRSWGSRRGPRPNRSRRPIATSPRYGTPTGSGRTPGSAPRPRSTSSGSTRRHNC